LSEVCVFHFTRVPDVLESTILENGPIAISLDAAETDQIRAVSESLNRELGNPTPLSTLRFSQALSTLSLIALQKVKLNDRSFSARRDEHIVEAAIGHYLGNMEYKSGVRSVARDINVSESHLRRIFQRSIGRSPAAVFRQYRLERAVELLGRPDLNVTEVGFECGFSSQSVFSRAFKSRFGVSPQEWRRGRPRR